MSIVELLSPYIEALYTLPEAMVILRFTGTVSAALDMSRSIFRHSGILFAFPHLVLFGLSNVAYDLLKSWIRCMAF